VVSPSVETLARLAAVVGEELARPQERAVPFEDEQLRASARRLVSERLELAVRWNEFAGEIAIAGARTREQQ
jgi:hypothetical protein